MTIETLPVGYFLDTWESVKKTEADQPVLVLLQGRIHGYLCFREEAQALSKALRIPAYTQRVLNRQGEITYSLIPLDLLPQAMQVLDEEGFILADRTPEGITKFQVLPAVSQLTLF